MSVRLVSYHHVSRFSSHFLGWSSPHLGHRNSILHWRSLSSSKVPSMAQSLRLKGPGMVMWGFPQLWGYPIAGWFSSWKILWKNGWFRGTPISGNLHVGMWGTTSFWGYLVLTHKPTIWMVRTFGSINFLKFDFACPVMIIATFLEFGRFEQRQAWPRTIPPCLPNPSGVPARPWKSRIATAISSWIRCPAALLSCRKPGEAWRFTESPSHRVTNLVTGAILHHPYFRGYIVHKPKFWGWLMVIMDYHGVYTSNSWDDEYMHDFLVKQQFFLFSLLNGFNGIV